MFVGFMVEGLGKILGSGRAGSIPESPIPLNLGIYLQLYKGLHVMTHALYSLIKGHGALWGKVHG